MQFSKFLPCNVGVQVPPAMYEKFGDTCLVRRVMLVLREVFNKILLSEPISPFNMLDLLQPCKAQLSVKREVICY